LSVAIGWGKCQFVLLVIVGQPGAGFIELLSLSLFHYFFFSLSLANYPRSISLSLILLVCIYIPLVLSSSRFSPLPQFTSPDHHRFRPFQHIYAHARLYIYIYVYICTSGNMTANFSKHAPFNGPHDTISLWSGALY